MDLIVITTVKDGESVITHISPQYLRELGVSSKEEFSNSIWMTSTEGEYSADMKLSDFGFAKFTGKCMFLHPFTRRSACIRFLTHCMKIEDSLTVYYTCVFDIAWEQKSDITDTLRRVQQCEMRRQIERDGLKYVAYPISSVFATMSAGSRKFAKYSLRCEGCVFGVNVAYPYGGGHVTKRSVLVPETSLFQRKRECALRNGSILKLW